jgi:hypothetical protein
MKKQLFTILLLGVFMLPVLSISSHATSANTKDKIGTSKKHRHHKKAVDQYYFVFYAEGGGTYEVRGSGAEFSGTITSAYEACVGHLIVGGTASGTYSYNTSTDVMTIDVTDTPTGSTEVNYSGKVPSYDYDSSPITVVCEP